MPLTLADVEATFDVPGRDAEGWSVIPTASDSRLYYVDPTSGNDGTATYYEPGDAAIGADVRNPTGSINAYATLEAAFLDQRPGQPDWVLLKRGEVFVRDEVALASMSLRAGRGVDERAVISSYGPSTVMPIVKTGLGKGFTVFSGIKYTAVQDIEWYAHTRDPNSVDFLGFGSVPGDYGFRVYGGAASLTEVCLIEGCTFSYFTAVIAESGTSAPENIVIRRNTFKYNYAEDEHSQGLFGNNASILFEENVMYHNGWLTQSYLGDNAKADGQAVIYNHNIYVANMTGCIFRNNILAEGSSMNMKMTANPPTGTDVVMTEDIFIYNNTLIGAEIALDAGGNTDNGNGSRWDNMNVYDNVALNMGELRPTLRNIGYGITAEDWAGGVVRNNVVAHYGDDSGAGTVISLVGLLIYGHTGTVSASGNVVYHLDGKATDKALNVASISPTSNITVSGNKVEVTADMQCAALDVIGATFSNNQYYSTNALPFEAASVDVDFDDWVTDVSSTGESFGAIAFPDPDRDLASYMTSLGETGTKAEYYTQIQALDRFNWNEDLLAPAVNDYIREGFGIVSGLGQAKTSISLRIGL